jgi:transposase
MLVDALGQPLRFMLTGGQVNDCTQAEVLLENVQAKAVLADKGYDTDQVLAQVAHSGAVAVIPPKSNRKIQREYDRELYKQRNLIERAFNKLKHCRRIATRYDRKACYFLAFLQLAAAHIWG